MLLFIVVLCLFVKNALALECYVCSNQTGNTEKCLNTIKTCAPEEDVCLSEVKWGSQPYWSQGALKQFYVSKKCSTKQYCTKIRNKYMKYCTHIWYEDWTCFDCCLGDRCNYYIISAANHMKKLWIGFLLAPLFIYFNKNFYL